VAPCSSDTSIINDLDLPGVILGHESLGVVEEVGELVTRFKPGDRVVVPCSTPDWEEPALQERGINNAHDSGWIKSFKFMISHDGVFAEHYKVNNANANLVHMPEDMSVEDALMTVDMMSTGFYAADNANVQFGDTVVVFGIGPVGLMAIAGATLRGAGRIFAIGTRPNCVALAKEYGATDIISYKDGDTVQQILDANSGQVDRAVIAIHDTACMNQALQLVRCNGNVSTIACIAPTEHYDIPMPLWGLGESDVTVKNGFCPGGAYRIGQMLKLIQNDRVHPGKLLNYKYDGFDKIEDAFWAMNDKPRDLVKPIVYIEH
jgi:threonine dehydrogenase-like Zn-dependent dehydrogenase